MNQETTHQISDNRIVVLLVDDQLIVGEAVRRLLAEERDICLQYCSNAHAAIGMAVQIKPTVILQDLVMPGINGIDLVRGFRQTPETAETPIIVLSSKEDPQVKSQAFAAGANDYLVKLPDVIELTARIRYHSAAYLNRLQRDQAFQALRESQEQLLCANAALKSTNEELEETTAVLTTSNAELEAFGYSVSHDLQSPLRSIDGFSKILLEEYGDQFDPVAVGHLNGVRAAAQRMGQLIDDLLMLLRLKHIEMQCEEVDLSALAEAVCVELKQRDPTRESEFVIADGLSARGDSRLLRIALENLLGNAWKFTSKLPRAHIEFGVGAQTNLRPEFFVRDNGAGFDMAYAGKIFGAFQRLHGSDEFPGTGIGLATVHGIIQRHGGRIWADGAVGQGAAFFFTLDSLPLKTLSGERDG